MINKLCTSLHFTATLLSFIFINLCIDYASVPAIAVAKSQEHLDRNSSNLAQHFFWGVREGDWPTMNRANGMALKKGMSVCQLIGPVDQNDNFGDII